MTASELFGETPAPYVRDIGVWFDSAMSMAKNVSHVCQMAYCQLRIYGLPDAQLRKLQLVQNSAARLVTGTRRREHITPVLFALHWLPIRQRIQFKYVCLSVSQRSQTTGRNSCSIVSGDVSN